MQHILWINLIPTDDKAGQQPEQCHNLKFD
jgi:hypothetical protein